MEKTKAIMKIESFSHKDGTLLLSVSDPYVRTLIKGLVDFCEKEKGGFIKLEMTPPYSQRSLDQNARYWARCTEFGLFTGNTKDEVSVGVKNRALEMGLWRGVDVPFSKTGKKVPDSTASADTAEMAVLDKVLDLIASEYGYIWEEDR